MKSLLLLIALVLTASIAHAYPQYHDISDTAAAQAEARERKLPLAYLGVVPGVLELGSPNPGSNADLAQRALSELQGRAVVITFNGHTMAGVPDFVHAQFHINDDGHLDDGGAWIVPKIVFTDPGLTKILGRVSHTQIVANGMEPIEAMLNSITSDPHALEPAAQPAAAAAQSGSSSTTDQTLGAATWIMNNGLFLAIGVLVVLVLILMMMGRRAR